MQERHYAGRYLRLQVLLIADLARRWMTRTVSSSVAQSFTTFSLEPSASNACCTDIDNVTVGILPLAMLRQVRLGYLEPLRACREIEKTAATARCARRLLCCRCDLKWNSAPSRLASGLVGGMCGNKNLTNPGQRTQYFSIGYPHSLMPLRL